MKLEIRCRGAPWGFVLAGIVGGAESNLSAATLHVPSAYPTIQDGIDAAAFGDTVLVAPGTYTDYSTRTVSGGGLWTSCAFLKDGVLLKSEGGPAVTMIDLIDITGPQRIGIIMRLLPSELTAVDGFTVEGRDRCLGGYIFLCGNASFRNSVFQNYDGGPTTGGAVIVDGDGSIIGCEFVNCKANSAGALWHTDGHLDFIGCIVRNCRNTPVNVQETGGGTVSAMIVDCQFIENTSSGGAGGLRVDLALGGATIRGCLFERNINTGSGGGGLGLGIGPKTVENCIFIENGALGSNGTGGGLFGGGAPFLGRNNTFAGNYKTANGAPGSAIQFVGSGVFENNIVVGSTAERRSTIFFN